MADVIVKGMEMPKACGCCCFCTLVPDWDECAINCAIVTEYQKRPKDCPIRPAAEWISVEERLPKTRPSILGQKSSKVIVAFQFDDGMQGTDTAHILNGDWVFEDRITVVNRAVTHWMPLPEPPEGGAGDG